MNLHRLLTSICLIVLISGCASLDVVMVAASGISYLVSGKSISDNIVSAVIDEDCAAHRLLLNKKVCVPTNKPVDMLATDGDTRIAANTLPEQPQTEAVVAEQPEVYQSGNNTVIARALDRSEQFEQLLPQTDTSGANREQVQGAAARHTLPQEVSMAGEIAKNMTPPHAPDDHNHYIENPQTFVVIGSFNELSFARERQISHMALNAEVVSNLHNDKTRFRVVVGPYNELDSEQSLTQLPELEQFSPWRINLCASSMAPPPCESSVVARVDF
ncbi:SPOR domain-containing protein [Thalassomonas haliotis]|uniref:SPOR domain-containing protein n=1 Tax=Thalassomonas haliotis TaxID=485448 RepID=A0ABY7VAU1_9GAMM|nr:SPOR domain-containing protein [Thalassomonas haliotis]WDE10194.1 hypothetical protein H3N35_18175 [Thalassomonas haliotis]